MRILIIEDEFWNYRELSQQIKSIDESIIIDGPVSTVHEVSKTIQECEMPYDAIFADICLADGTVFDAFPQNMPSIPVVFVTAYEEYAIKAFDYNGIAYLLKPVTEQSLRDVLHKITGGYLFKLQFSWLKGLLSSKDNCYRENFMIAHQDYCEMISIDAVNHIVSENSTTYLVLNSGKKVLIDHSLYELENELNPRLFFRVNRQCIVHRSHVKRLFNGFQGKSQLELDLSEEIRIDVSRERSILLKQWMDM